MDATHSASSATKPLHAIEQIQFAGTTSRSRGTDGELGATAVKLCVSVSTQARATTVSPHALFLPDRPCFAGRPDDDLPEVGERPASPSPRLQTVDGPVRQSRGKTVSAPGAARDEVLGALHVGRAPARPEVKRPSPPRPSRPRRSIIESCNWSMTVSSCFMDDASMSATS